MQQPSIMSFDTRFILNLQATAFPFACKLSLAPLVAFWNQAVPGEAAAKGVLVRMIQNTLRQAPALLGPLEDLSVIAQHRELVDVLMTIVFSPASWERTYAAALTPFHLRSFYATPSFERLLMADDGTLRGRVNVDAQTVAHVRVLHAYAFILQRVYGLNLDFEYPLIFTTTDPDTGLDRHFKPNLDERFVEVRTVGEVPPLTDDTKQHLLANLADPQVLMALLPPDRFIFEGFTVLHAEEVTDQEVLSSLKRDLIEKESIISATRFQGLQEKLRTLFRKPELLFGLAALQGERVFILNSGSRIKHG